MFILFVDCGIFELSSGSRGALEDYQYEKERILRR